LKDKIKQAIENIDNDLYGNALDILLEFTHVDTQKLDIKNYSDFILAKGILWELVENFPIAHKHYEKALKINPKNLLTNQYFAHILSKKGEYPRSKKVFQEWFQKRAEGIHPFKVNRGFLGFRYRSDDIDLLESFKAQNKEEQELKTFLLGLYYFSIYNLELALQYIEKINNPTNPFKIIKLIAEYLTSKDKKVINNLSELKLEGENVLFLEINKIT